MANKETARKAAWAQRTREWLLEKLGGVCAMCGAKEDLAVDHKNGRAWDPNKMSQAGRVRRYRDEFLAGVELRALCRTCNGRYNPYK